MNSTFFKLTALAGVLLFTAQAHAKKLSDMSNNIDSALYTNKVHAPLISPLTVAKLNLQQGWPALASRIPGMSNVLSVTTAGHYAWAIGLRADRAKQQYESMVAFYTGANWVPAETLPGMEAVAAIVPLKPEQGDSAQAFALDIDKIGYFDGSVWHAAQMLADMPQPSVISSEGHAWAWSQDPDLHVSSFDLDHEAWTQPLVQPELSQVRASAAGNGYAYLLGNNANGQTVLLKGDQRNTWHANVLPIHFRPYQQQLGVAGDSVYVALSSNSGSAMLVSRDHGETWQRFPYQNGLLLNHPGSTRLWQVIDSKHIALIDLAAAHPLWQVQTLPAAMTEMNLYSMPSPDAGRELCVESDLPQPMIACYDSHKQAWLSLPDVAGSAVRIDGIVALGKGRVAAFGVDRQNQAAAFYLHDQTWQTTVVSGMRGMVENFSHSSQRAANTDLWIMGQD